MIPTHRLAAALLGLAALSAAPRPALAQAQASTASRPAVSADAHATLVREAWTAYGAKDYARSADLYARAFALRRDPAASDLYNAACSAALAGRKDDAFRFLHRAVDAGFGPAEHVLVNDSDLATLRADARWPAVREKLEERTRREAALPKPHEAYSAVIRSGDYLGALDTLLALERRHAAGASLDWRSLLGQFLAYARSFVGDHGGALAEYDRLRGPSSDTAPSADPLAGHRARDARDAILAAADTAQVVMLNEAHHLAIHRAFTASLLEDFHRRGFRYLAVEAVSAEDTALAARGYPAMKTGIYTKEPVFGDLVRRALELGFTVVGYDSFGTCDPAADGGRQCFNVRDSLEAVNIVNRIFRKDPAAKVVVHAGYSHVVDKPYNGVVPMAARLREMTGIDPFTVDQTWMTEGSAPEYESPVYRAALDAGRVAAPTVFVAASGEFFRDVRGGFRNADMQVFHPRTRRVQGRPHWMAHAGRESLRLYGEARGGVAGPFLRTPTRPVLVQAFVAGEGDDAVPADQVLVTGDDAPVLMLRPGRYRIVAREPGGREVARIEVTMPVRGTGPAATGDL
jgi:hypothetical protein